MNKSYEYIKNRIESKQYLVDDFNVSVKDLRVVKLADISKEFCNNIKKPFVIASVGDDPVGYLTYRPRINYDYFITRTIVTDGMLVPPVELLRIIINDVCELKSYCGKAPLADEVKKVKDADEFKKFQFHYEIGDLVTAHTYLDKSPDPKRPWLTDKAWGMLPCRFTITKKG